MLANKNNHLIKQILRKSGGKTVAPTVEQSKAEVELETKPADLSEAEVKAEAEPEPDEPIQIEYPDTKYLYRNIQNLNYPSTKTYVCAFHLADNFVKYIVETKDTKVEFPSFEFENIQKGGFLDDDIASGDLDMSFQNNVIEFVQSFFVDTTVPVIQQEEVISSPQTLGEEEVVSTPQTLGEEEVVSTPQTLGEEEVVSTPQTLGEEEVVSTPQTLGEEEVASSPQTLGEEEAVSLPQTLGEEEVASSPQTLGEEEVASSPQTLGEEVSLSESPSREETPIVTKSLTKGGSLDESSKEEPSEEQATKEEPSEEHATKEESSEEPATKEEPSEEHATKEESSEEPATKEESSEEQATKEEPSDVFAITENPEYIGFVKGKESSIYVFVKIPSEYNLKPEYNNSILNELFHTYKVYDKDVDDSIRTLFENNTWLLDDKEPYSGYMCKFTENGQLANVKEQDGDEVGELINIDSIGDYYYFSFLPIDMENAKEYKRFAIFPNEYVCIHNETQMAEYKENKSAYARDKSIYFKDTEGREFFAVKTPSQFVKE